MQTYRNLNQTSDILGYKIGKGSIRLLLRSGTFCIYSSSQIGEELFDKMKSLAVQGQGLSEFIENNNLLQYARRV